MNSVLKINKFNVCHANVQSLCAQRFCKFEEMKAMLMDSRLSVACFSETWLTESISVNAISIHGFNIVRNDRVHKRGGGIILYIREGLRYKVVLASNATNEDRTECLCVEVDVSGVKVLLIAMYNPPNTNPTPYLQNKLADLMPTYEHIILTGDLNVDWLRTGFYRDTMENVFQSFGLSVIGTEPTHFQDDSCSLIDLFVTNHPEKVSAFNQVSVSCLSRHDMIFGSYDLDVHQVICPNTYRDYINFDAIALRAAVEGIPWQQFYDMDNVDELMVFFNSQISAIHESCIPIREV